MSAWGAHTADQTADTMLRAATLILAALAAANAASYSLYPFDCGCATSISLPSCAPAPVAACAPAPLPVCAPVAPLAAPAGCSANISPCNLNAIVALLGTLKNSGLVPSLTPSAPNGLVGQLLGLLGSPGVASNPLITANLLNLISLVVGGGPAAAPVNGTLPLLGGASPTGSLLNLDLLTGGTSGGGLVGGLLGGLLGGGSGAAGGTPAALNTILLQLLASLASPNCAPAAPVCAPACALPTCGC